MKAIAINIATTLLATTTLSIAALTGNPAQAITFSCWRRIRISIF